jgi:hypothetical protein
MAWAVLRLRHKTWAWASTCMCAISRENSMDSIQQYFLMAFPDLAQLFQRGGLHQS